MKKCLCIAVFLIFAGSSHSFGEPFNRIGQGIRNQGMGNVGIALSHDENALQYNPAGLIGVDNFFVSLGLLGEVSDDAINLTSELQELSDSSTADTLEIALGKKLRLRFLINANILIPADGFVFGISALGEVQFGFAFENPVLPEISFYTQADQVQTYGLAFPIGRGGLVIGVAMRMVQRLSLYPPVEISLDNLITAGSDTGDLTDQYSGAGTIANGQGYDIGIHWRVEGDWSMTIGAVAQNLGSMTFAGAAYPKAVPTEYSVGFSFQPGNDYFRLLYAFDLRDLTMEGTSDRDLTKRIHTGIEFGILPIDSGTSFLAFRSGYNQGYFSYGFEINPFVFARFITIQVAAYGEETGETAGSGKEARRSFQLSFAF